MANLIQTIDAKLFAGLSGWNIYTSLLLLFIFTIFIYPVFFSPDPDLHPLLLTRQSFGSRVRYPGESATFRALDAPQHYPLRSGLNVKDPGQPKWQQGRDGDLRDIWRKAITGAVDANGEKTEEKGTISVVLGREEVITYELDAMSKEVNAVGNHLKLQGATRVAVYLSNSVELLVTLFACTFYNLTPILIPHQSDLTSLSDILKQTTADTLIVGAGAIPLTELVKLYEGLKQVVWVVARKSRHMDWHVVPEDEGGKAAISVWHEIIEESGAHAEVPATEGEAATNIVIVPGMQGEEAGFDVVEYTQGNVVAAVAAQLAVLPRTYSSTQLHHLTPADTLLSLAPLTDLYPLVLTLAALYANASVALTSVSGPTTTYASAFLGVSPTVLIALPPTLSRLVSENKARLSSTLSRYFHRRKLQTLASGSMPRSSHSSVRIIYTYDASFSSGRSTLTGNDLANLRVFTGARVIYAHTHPSVAGAVMQTGMLDYRSDPNVPGDRPSHIGPPLSCLELKLLAPQGEDVDDDALEGRPSVSGPAVVGGEAKLDEVLRITDRRVFAYAK